MEEDTKSHENTSPTYISPMKHTEAKAFVRKYNSELAIRGYSKMKKADLAATIERKLVGGQPVVARGVGR